MLIVWWNWFMTCQGWYQSTAFVRTDIDISPKTDWYQPTSNYWLLKKKEWYSYSTRCTCPLSNFIEMESWPGSVSGKQSMHANAATFPGLSNKFYTHKLSIYEKIKRWTIQKHRYFISDCSRSQASILVKCKFHIETNGQKIRKWRSSAFKVKFKVVSFHLLKN